ncbi:MAG: 50S ribosomal protein L3 N(5)-glutamine methyltransferase [Verrucomicrobia bacterium]|nr:50S ribosomal protein L3 N(5)-glutamine methyltransferase [Verrucomicrobiota bacterium]
MATSKKTTSVRRKAPQKPVHPVTLGDWLKHAIVRYKETGAALGQIAANAHDEALYLLLRTLALPLDSKPSILKYKPTTSEAMALEKVLHRRLDQRVPAAYLTREAFLGEYRFYVDERVIIPRSYFLEIIPQQLNAWLPDPGKVKRVVDVCTGSGCLAILLAHHFPQARVDAIDLSPDALDVARINVKKHRLVRRVKLYESDVFDAVPKAKYDVILSNPPYEPSAHCDQLPTEFHREPRMALDGGKDGLDIIRKLLLQARDRLQPHGVVLIEVGGLQRAMDKEFAALDLYWMHTADGSNCVCLIQAERLRKWKG